MAPRWLRGMAGWICCLLWLPAAAAAQTRPIEGHENWKLGMTMAEALAAEPRAESHDCGEAVCLRYADRRFATAVIAVSGRFGAADALDVIIVTMAVKPGNNRCQQLSARLAAFYTAAHGETMPLSEEGLQDRRARHDQHPCRGCLPPRGIGSAPMLSRTARAADSPDFG